MSRWLVTGGAGFIGSNLVQALVERGETVRVVDNLSTGRRENLEPLRGRIEFIPADLADLAAAQAAVKDADYVLHQAALGSVPRSVKDPLTTNRANVTATLNLLVAARDAKVRRVVLAGSSSVYGGNPSLPRREDLTPMPLSPYAVSKLAQEQYCLAFHAVYGLDTVVLRYFNVYGPRQDPNSTYAAVIPLFVTAALRGSAPTIHGDGDQSRDFTFVADVVAANLAAATTPGIAGRLFNIAAGESCSINRLWELIARLVNATASPQHLPPRPGDVRHSNADISAARASLPWSPRTGLEDGLRQTIDALRSL